ncbi:MAG TPA: CsbD family protein [Humidesulfovibrio sp.]|uniref:CsbD family protein n=1 Tax=Humidesulfovibrio sp. TaxID=2910988 RepID=UPI002B675784|nr:CsbD family protein [Humidesulfovibrio sp.]HWR02766.1 CsbD family protein [Humidesulfovibrio sp.]
MKSSTEDKVEGELHKVSGNIKEAVGKVTDNPKLTAKGQAENMAGKVQVKVGEIKKVAGK